MKSSIFGKKFEYSEDGFKDFNDLINTKIEEDFKIDEKLKRTKRNRFVNPWITNSIIASINKKFYYQKILIKTSRKVIYWGGLI